MNWQDPPTEGALLVAYVACRRCRRRIGKVWATEGGHIWCSHDTGPERIAGGAELVGCCKRHDLRRVGYGAVVDLIVHNRSDIIPTAFA